MLYGLSCNRFDSKVALVCCRQRSRTVCGWGMASPCTDSRRNQTAKTEMNLFKWFKWIFSNFVFQKLRDWVVQHCDQFSNGFLRSTSEMVRNDPALVVCWLGRVSAKVPAIGPDDCAGKQSHLQKLEVKSWKRTKTALFIFNCLDICLCIHEFDFHFKFQCRVSTDWNLVLRHILEVCMILLSFHEAHRSTLGFHRQTCKSFMPGSSSWAFGMPLDRKFSDFAIWQGCETRGIQKRFWKVTKKVRKAGRQERCFRWNPAQEHEEHGSGAWQQKYKKHQPSAQSTCKVPVLERWRRLCEWGPGKRYKEDVACVVRVDD